MSYAISARGKRVETPIEVFLSLFGDIDIDSVFGFYGPCRLYGGRPYFAPEISADDLGWMYAKGIGFRIPLQTTIANMSDYRAEREFLDAHHRVGNSVIIARSRFAKAIRSDFPLYQIEASVIQNINSVSKIMSALELYDTVVPDPFWFNNSPEAASIPLEVRDRIRLFVNAGCMYTCKQRICYTAVSKMNLGVGVYQCSMANGVKRDYKGSMYEFDVNKYISNGYSKFKILRSNGYTGY